MKSMARLLTVGALALASACEAEAVDPAEPDVGSDTLEIRGGRARNDHPEIGRVWMKKPRHKERLGFCTATLVDRRVAITAGHCVNLGTSSRPGDYGFLEIFREEFDQASGTKVLRTHHYQVDMFKAIGPSPLVVPALDDIALIRLKTPVPCNVARPAKLSKNGPPAGTVVSRWGYGNCAVGVPNKKRVRHFRRGQVIYTICPGDSGGPTMDPNGAVYEVNSGWETPLGRSTRDVVGILAFRWGLIQDQIARWRAGGCP